MGCDFYIEKSLIIDYISVKGQVCKIAMTTKREKGYIDKYEPGSYKYEKRLEKKMEKNSYVKMIYEKKIWVKEGYQQKYESKIRKWFPEIKNFIKIYKDSIAWSK
jgi:hypothetical protein